MRNLKKLVALFVTIAMITTLIVPALADSSFTYEGEAEDLYDLGLFKGESETEYLPNLGDMLSREAGAIMFLRLTGEEDDALEMSDGDASAKLAIFSDGAEISNWAKKQVAYATDKGYIKGYPDGTFAPKAALNGKAYSSLVLQLLGYDGDFNYHEAATSLSEVGGLTSSEAATFNTDNAINRDAAVGISFGALKATVKGTEETLVQKLVRLGKVDQDMAKDKGLIDAIITEVGELEDVYVKIGETAEMPKTVEVTYDDEETGEVSVTWPEIDTSEVGEQEIEGIIAGTALAAKVKVIVQPDELLVTSVTADNLKEVVVEFSAALDEDTVNTDNIEIDGFDKDISVELEEDGRTVVITAGKVGENLENQKTYTLKVKNVKDTTGMEVEETEKEFEVFDGTRPVAEEVKVTGPANLEITFSEPIKEDSGDVEIKSGNSTIGTGDYSGYGSRTISIVIWDDMKDGETYEVIVKDFKDYAKFINVSKTFEIEYVKDTEPPVAEITKVDQMYVKVEFSKPVTGLHKENFYHTFTAWEAKGIYKDEAMTDEIKAEDSVSTVWVKFADDADEDRPLAEGTQRVGIRGKYDDVEVKDNWGNKFEGTEIEVAVSVDKENPEVTSITVEGEDELKITFNKVVKFDEDNIEILDTDGKEIDGVDVGVDSNDEAKKEFKVTLGKDSNLAGKTIIVKITDVEDTALQPNKLSEHKETVEITDKTAPKVTKVSKDAKYLYIFFDEDVTNTALDKDNYKIMASDGTLTSFDKAPRFFDGSRVVRIELTEKEKNTIIADDLFIQNIEDKAGNAMKGQIYKDDIKDTASDAPKVYSVEATAKDKLVITFDQRLLEGNNIKPEAFEVKIGADDSAEIKSLSVSRNGDGNTVVTLNLKKEEIISNATNVKLNIVGNENYLKNVFEIAAEESLDIQVVDKIAPSYDKDSITAIGNEVTIKFDEKIKDATVSLYTFEVRNNEVTDFDVDVNDEEDISVVTLTLKKSYVKGDKVRVSQKYDIEDEEAGNKYRNTDTIEVTVVANPTIASIDNDNVGDVTVSIGTGLNDAIDGLDKTVTITDSEGNTHEVTLEWTIQEYDGNTANNYEATGTFELPLGVDQADPEMDLKVTATVTVEGDED